MIRKIKRRICIYYNSLVESLFINVAFWGEKKFSRQQRNEFKLLLFSHSLEKGMGVENPKKGFGQQKAVILLESLNEEFLEKSEKSRGYAFDEAMSVLGCYLDYTVKSGVNIEPLRNEYQRLHDKTRFNTLRAGIEIYRPEEIYSKMDKEFVEFFITSRHSVRSFINQPVSNNVMENVLRMASNYPSACNRQPVKVYYTSDKETVDNIAKCIPGNQGFEKEIHNWAIIAVDKLMFGKTEILQWYVNGGIYVSHFVLALHANCLGSCIFQLPISYEKLSEIREIAGIPGQYATICAVGFGYPKEKVRRLMAERMPISEVGVRF